MSADRNKYLKFFLSAIFMIIILAGCGTQESHLTQNPQSTTESQPEQNPADFSKLFKDKNPDDLIITAFNDLTLTIYYLSPFSNTRIPVSIDMLIYGSTENRELLGEKNDLSGLYDAKFVVKRRKLMNHPDLLTQINNAVLVPASNGSYISARLYYKIESERDGKILEVFMWNATENSIFVNGVEYEDNPFFVDIIRPFLSESVLKELDYHLRLKAERPSSNN